MYRIRVRDRGPDFRTFVTESTDGVLQCSYETCRNAQDARQRSLQSDSHGTVKSTFDCELIRRVQVVLDAAATDNTAQQGLHLEKDFLHKLPFPVAIKGNLQKLGENNLIQRVSEESL